METKEKEDTGTMPQFLQRIRRTCDHIYEWNKQLQEDRAAAEQRANEAERLQYHNELLSKQLATERARHAAMAAEFEKIADKKHPRYWTLEPGDVLFRPTGETRCVTPGESFVNKYGGFITWKNNVPTYNQFAIYRRIEAPAAAAPQSPAPAAAEGEDIVEYDGKRYRRDRNYSYPKTGDKFWHDPSNDVWTANHDYQNNAWRLVHEITEPLPPPVSEQEGEPPAPAEASEGSKADWSPEVESFYAPAAESGKWEYPEYRVADIRTFDRNGPHGAYAIICNGKSFTQAERDMLWIQKRAEIESQLAQLSKYKRDAESWEKASRDADAVAAMRSKNISVVRLFHKAIWEARHDVVGTPYTKSHPCADPADAVLALAAQLDQSAASLSQQEGT